MKKLFAVLLCVSLLCLSSALGEASEIPPAEIIDAGTSASVADFYGTFGISGDDLMNAINSYSGFYAVATVNEDGTPNTAHSLNPVQFVVINAGDEVTQVKDGALCNVAPTILKLMGIPQPAAMTAEPLI